MPATESTLATERMPMLEPKHNPIQSLGQGDSALGLSRVPSTLDLDFGRYSTQHVGDNGLQFIRSMATTVSLMSCAHLVACELACRQGATSAAHVP